MKTQTETKGMEANFKDCTHILFDLDGTLLDSYSGVRASLEEAFVKYGLEYGGDFWEFLGPPLQTALPEVLGISQELANSVYEFQRAAYDAKWVHNFTPYAGIKDLLEELRACGKVVCVVTSKLEGQAKIMLGEGGLLQHIVQIFGQEGERQHKLDVLRHALSAGNLDGAKCVMVGDRHFDLNAASALGVRSIGVAYGYGAMDELRACNPTAIAMDVGELRGMLGIGR